MCCSWAVVNNYFLHWFPTNALKSMKWLFYYLYIQALYLYRTTSPSHQCLAVIEILILQFETKLDKKKLFSNLNIYLVYCQLLMKFRWCIDNYYCCLSKTRPLNGKKKKSVSLLLMGHLPRIILSLRFLNWPFRISAEITVLWDKIICVLLTPF